MGNEYVELARLVREQGLLERQYGYYAMKLLFNIGLLAISVLILITIDSFAIQLLNSVFLAFVVVQFGMVMHDADHYQVFKSTRNNELLGLITGNLVMNVSSGRWREVHNRHHGSPNHEEEDPDVKVPGIAYSEEQILKKRGVARFVAKNQAYFWLLIMSLAAFSMRLNHHRKVFLDLFRNLGRKQNIIEAALLATGTSFYFWLVFSSLGLRQGVAFTAVNYLLTGLYMGTVFATNHKAMPLVKEKFDFLHMQVLTTRNVKSNFLVDLWTGGLNYQIEHHLFPTMPRNNLGKAQHIIRPFCEQHGISYYETGFWRSYKEILRHFQNVSSVLRRPRPSPSDQLAE